MATKVVYVGCLANFQISRQRSPHMHRDTNLPALPALTADLLRDNGLLVDNLFADLWKQVGMDALLKRAGFGKRSGTPVSRLAFSLVLWVWLKAGSIALFARESLHVFCDAE